MRYLFDLMGFVVLNGALSPTEVADCNEAIDRRNLWEERNNPGSTSIYLTPTIRHRPP